MSAAEPLLPHAGPTEDTVAAADPGPGAPPPAPGFGIGGEEPDVAEDATGDEEATPPRDTPFRSPDGSSVTRDRLEDDLG
ncbi:hypothetical protein [Cellulomonas hominis]|uniref:hypothetical protein n=1 Tax=Cellulomonas hominis TaxID=156981 RepID=UPI001BA18531|nr:hypothetical protein [Cellulomonas hominis]VTR76158.1 hypothetical protein CHMI_00914 [Cellulomonas hominis]